MYYYYREKGGAYGGGVTGASPGLYKFYSYRWVFEYYTGL